MFDIVAIGSTTRDNFLKADYQLIDWPHTSLKKAIVFPFGEKVEVSDVYSTIGGNAVNAGVTFARQGFKTACLAKLGDDLAAKELKARLKTEKVNTKLIVHSKEKSTAFSVLLLKDGERTILGYHGASDTLTLKDINLRRLKSKWWYLSLAGESDSIYLDLLEFAKKNKIQVAFNPSGHHLRHKKEEILSSLNDLAFLVLNEDEASILTGVSFDQPEKVFRTLDKIVPGIVAVTSGGEGVMVSDNHNLYRAGIFREQKIVDRTGAGDAFGSGFVSGLMMRSKNKKEIDRGKPNFNEDDIKYAIRLASANATSVVENLGATEGILTYKQFAENQRWANFEIQTIPLS